MAILGTWVTFLIPKPFFHLLYILCHIRPIYATFTPFYAILQQQPCSNESTHLKYTIWGTSKKSFGQIEQDPWIWCIC
jgi:hypothetical protein